MESLDTFATPPTQDEKNIALLCHIGTFFGGIIVPLVVWLLKNDQSEFVAHHAKESMNFQISVLLYIVISTVFMIVVIGFFMILAIGLVAIIMIILAAISASSGNYYRYPMTIRFLK